MRFTKLKIIPILLLTLYLQTFFLSSWVHADCFTFTFDSELQGYIIKDGQGRVVGLTLKPDGHQTLTRYLDEYGWQTQIAKNGKLPNGIYASHGNSGGVLGAAPRGGVVSPELMRKHADFMAKHFENVFMSGCNTGLPKGSAESAIVRFAKLQPGTVFYGTKGPTTGIEHIQLRFPIAERNLGLYESLSDNGCISCGQYGDNGRGWRLVRATATGLQYRNPTMSEFRVCLDPNKSSPDEVFTRLNRMKNVGVPECPFVSAESSSALLKPPSTTVLPRGIVTGGVLSVGGALVDVANQWSDFFVAATKNPYVWEYVCNRSCDDGTILPDAAAWYKRREAARERLDKILRGVSGNGLLMMPQENMEIFALMLMMSAEEDSIKKGLVVDEGLKAGLKKLKEKHKQFLLDLKACAPAGKLN